MENYRYTDDTKTSIYFGLYPQTQVIDEALIERLNKKIESLNKNIAPLDINKYRESNIRNLEDFFIDIEFSGNKYRKHDGIWFKFEPIKWRILSTNEKEAFILSDLLLDSKVYSSGLWKPESVMDYQGNYNKEKIYVTNYKYSYVRSWLNTDFYKIAFNTLEQKIIKTTLVDNESKYILPCSEEEMVSPDVLCENTYDKIFLLSYSEIIKYFPKEDQPSDDILHENHYIVADGSEYVREGYEFYWLRSPEREHRMITSGIHGSFLCNSGAFINSCNGVRPACVIEL